MAESRFTLDNTILKALPWSERKVILAGLETVQLSPDALIHQFGRPVEKIYFPEDAIISYSGRSRGGRRIELWSVGREGLAGIWGLVGATSPFRGVVQVGGKVLAGELRAMRRVFQRKGSFHDLVLKYQTQVMRSIAQNAFCHSHHDVIRRLSGWLLAVSHRTRSRTLLFTQEAIAGVLGTRRATISAAANALEDSGMIECRPGVIRILNRRRLLAAACSCSKLMSTAIS